MPTAKAITKVQAVLIAVVLIFVISAGVYFYSSSMGNQMSAQKVTFVTDMLAPYLGLIYYGVDHGIYAKHGIDLTFISASGSVGGISVIASGKADFGIADPGTLLLASRSNVTNVRLVASILQRTSFSIIYNKANITKLSDLNGKTLGDFQGNAVGIMFKALAKTNNLNLSSIKVVTASPTTFNNLVAIGRVDGVFSMVGRIATLEPVAAKQNIQLGVFPYVSYGLDIPGLGLITSTQLISGQPNLVKSFVQATTESMIQAAGNPADAVAAFTKHNPELNSSTNLDYFRITAKNSLPNVNSSTYSSDALKIGWIDPQKMQYTIQVTAQAYGIANPPSASSFYTNEFVHSP